MVRTMKNDHRAVLNRYALADMATARSLSKSALAVRAQISLSYLSELWSGTKTTVSLDVLGQLAKALELAHPESLRADLRVPDLERQVAA